jgi:hypothetical protein
VVAFSNGYIFLDSGDEIVMGLDKDKSSLVTFKTDFEGRSGLLKSKV